MSPTTSLEPPAAVFGPDGAPCPSCHAPLAGDQRYCLYCGTRRSEARFEFLDVLADDARQGLAGTPPVEVWSPAPYAAPAAAYLHPGAPAWGAPPPREPGINGWLRANAPVLGLAGLLLGTLLIGLLLGHWAGGGSGNAPKTQVVRIIGAGTGAAAGTAAPAAAAGTAAGAGAAAGAAKASKNKATSSAKAVTKTPKGTVSVDKLKSLKGKDYSKAVDKLAKQGKPISTGTGKLPPKDNKPAGNGTSFETIG